MIPPDLNQRGHQAASCWSFRVYAYAGSRERGWSKTRVGRCERGIGLGIPSGVLRMDTCEGHMVMPLLEEGEKLVVGPRYVFGRQGDAVL